MVNRKSLTIFLVLAFLISWPLFLVPLAFKNGAGQTQQIVAQISFSVAMWGPGIAAFFAVILAWFAILVTGQYPRALFELVDGILTIYTELEQTMTFQVRSTTDGTTPIVEETQPTP